MADNQPSYTFRLGMASLCNNDKLIESLMQTMLNDIAVRIMDGVAYHYSPDDLAFVVAVLKIVANGLENSILSETDKALVNMIINHTDCMTIDMSKLHKQMKGDAE